MSKKNFKVQNVLVTGCTGFIGFNLCNNLLLLNSNVIGIDNLSASYDSSIQTNRLKKLKEHNNFSFIKADLLNFSKIKKILKKYNIDIIIHLAANVGVRESILEPLKYVDNNIKATNNLLELCRLYDINQFIFSSSSSVYGNNNGALKETMLPHPTSPYGVSKRSCELYGETYSYLYSVNFCSLRLFSVYGPHQRPDMAIHRFVHAIRQDKPIVVYGDGSTKRDFTYVDDIVKGFMKATKKRLKFEIINLGTGKSISLSSLIKKIEQYTGKKAKIIYKAKYRSDAVETLADITKAKELLDYEPKVTIDEGLKKYISWVEKNSNL
ncbi:MAG: GDP-mannose 4,6-dehydratase [Candidatus Heimdallarchaeum endolithica]|uniref:GDP-mannose 4,6-dehydratase n=1 Tax=Candidatus Heimdallarchaeum endolithica TaxID=2876572 RepID=A0A9Y1BSH9_9ARCH|nr:MAG: GDP-mannose 4,6-dehydratase [Candidatus Heimdallarchaeum endolithica]